ncbi:hypothetical protein E2C01_027570 [Portunus trituberculatus]|uniref:Uncharacterized protein n=1 Tax=Portunus trituberculatus TaxID=210409 RepID=A0A5B7ELZ7_PORTR|nr:hypothetical protein [Portunus trituberculatus]
MQADRLLNTPVPLMDKTCTTHSLPFPALSSKQKPGPAPAHHLMFNMPPKRPPTSPAMPPSIAKKTRKSLTLEVVQWNHACFGGPRGLQAHGFESFPRSECRLGFLTRGNGFLTGGL